MFGNRTLTTYIRSTEGATAVEYALLTSILAIGTISGVSQLEGEMDGYFSSLAQRFGDGEYSSSAPLPATAPDPSLPDPPTPPVGDVPGDAPRDDDDGGGDGGRGDEGGNDDDGGQGDGGRGDGGRGDGGRGDGGRGDEGGNDDNQGGNDDDQGGNDDDQGGNDDDQGGNDDDQGGNDDDQGGNDDLQGGFEVIHENVRHEEPTGVCSDYYPDDDLINEISANFERSVRLTPRVPGQSQRVQPPSGVEVGIDLFHGYGGDALDHLSSAYDYYSIYTRRNYEFPREIYARSSIGYFGVSYDGLIISEGFTMGIERIPLYCKGTDVARHWEPNDPLNRDLAFDTNNNLFRTKSAVGRNIATAEGWPYRFTFDARTEIGRPYPFEVLLDGEVIATFHPSDLGNWDRFTVEFMGTHTGESELMIRDLRNEVDNPRETAVGFDNLEVAAGHLYEDGSTEFLDEVQVAEMPSDRFRIVHAYGPSDYRPDGSLYLIYHDGKAHEVVFDEYGPNYFRDTSREYPYVTMEEIRTALNTDEFDIDRFETYALFGEEGYNGIYGPSGDRYDPAYYEDPAYIFSHRS